MIYRAAEFYLVPDPETGYYTKVSLTPHGESIYTLHYVHSSKQCEGRNCVIHNNPSLHPLTMEPAVWNDEETAVERVCVHGVVHPDVDDLDYRKTVGQYYVYLEHECDGCCGLEQPK